MKGERKDSSAYNAEADEHSDQMRSPFRLLHISNASWTENIYSGYAILVKTDDKTQVLVKLIGNRGERKKINNLLSSLEKLVRVEHSIATERGFQYKDLMNGEQMDSYRDESKRIRNEFFQIGIELP